MCAKALRQDSLRRVLEKGDMAEAERMSPADWVPYCVPGTILSTSLVAYKYPQEPRRQGFIINYLQLRPQVTLPKLPNEGRAGRFYPWRSKPRSPTPGNS